MSETPRSASWSSPTTPPPRWRRSSTASRRRSAAASTRSSSPTMPAPTAAPPTWSVSATRPGAATCRSPSSATRRTWGTAVTRRPATATPSTRASTSSCMLHGDGQYAPEALPEILEPLIQGRGRRGVRVPHDGARCRPARRDAAVQVRRQQDPVDHAEQAAAARTCRSSTRATGPTACKALCRHPLRAQRRRVQLRHPDHPAALRRRQAHRRGADPDLLRRRDLPRQRHEVRQGHHRRHACATGCRRWASAAARWPTPATPTASSPPRTPATGASCAAWPSEPPVQGARPGLLVGPARRRAAPPRPSRDRRRRHAARRGRATGSTTSSSPTSSRASRPRWAPASTWSSPATSSSTSATASSWWPTCARCVRPGGFVLASVPNISHWYPRLRIATGRFGYDQRGILDQTHLRFFTRRTFERLVAEAGLRIRRTEATGLPLDAMTGSRRARRLRPPVAAGRHRPGRRRDRPGRRGARPEPVRLPARLRARAGAS